MFLPTMELVPLHALSEQPKIDAAQGRGWLKRGQKDLVAVSGWRWVSQERLGDLAVQRDRPFHWRSRSAGINNWLGHVMFILFWSVIGLRVVRFSTATRPVSSIFFQTWVWRPSRNMLSSQCIVCW